MTDLKSKVEKIQKHLIQHDAAHLKAVCKECSYVAIYLFAYQFRDAGWRYLVGTGLICGGCVKKNHTVNYE